MTAGQTITALDSANKLVFDCQVLGRKRLKRRHPRRSPPHRAVARFFISWPPSRPGGYTSQFHLFHSVVNAGSAHVR